MFIPVYQGLTPSDLARPVRWGRTAYPFDAPRHWYFYRARNAIYHLFRAIAATRPDVTVLAPEYNSGNEVLAMQAAGATIRYCKVDEQLRLDPDEVARCCDAHRPDVLYVIHYAGWPQPIAALAEFCRSRGLLLVEDCALALLSGAGSRPLGTFGDWAVFCLYKTLPLPNGAVLAQNTLNSAIAHALDGVQLHGAGVASAAGRTAELLVQRLRSRSNRVGSALYDVKQRIGRGISAMHVRRAAIGDIGFEIADVNLAMSPLSSHVLHRLDFDAIRSQRIRNFKRMTVQLRDRATRLFEDLPHGACPLFFPVLVPDKHAAATALQARGVDALEFWNDRIEMNGYPPSPIERFLRRHVLELPIHQDLTADHIDYVAEQVAALDLRMPNAARTVVAA